MNVGLIIISALIYLALVVCIVILFVALVREQERVKLAEQKARADADEYITAREKEIRKDAIARSTAVVKGKVAEQYALYDLPYNPRDARFLGSPIDFLIFDGLTEGDLERVVFLEVKTGKTGRLTKRERQVRDIIDEMVVEYEVYHIQ